MFNLKSNYHLCPQVSQMTLHLHRLLPNLLSLPYLQVNSLFIHYHHHQPHNYHHQQKHLVITLRIQWLRHIVLDLSDTSFKTAVILKRIIKKICKITNNHFRLRLPLQIHQNIFIHIINTKNRTYLCLCRSFSHLSEFCIPLHLWMLFLWYDLMLLYCQNKINFWVKLIL